MSLVARPARNHPQQVGKRGPNPAVDDRATSPEVFGPLNDRFRFSIDVAASAQNTKCERFYSIEDNGLAQRWTGERVWCNPPYSDIRPWVEKAWDEFHTYEPDVKQDGTLSHAFCRFCDYGDEGWCPGGYEAPRAEAVVLLVPGNRTEQAWWQKLVEPYRDRPWSPLHAEFLPGRLRFIAPGAEGIGPNERPPFGCVLLIWERP